MLVGYARASTAEQSPALRQDALTTAGCGRVYTDVASGALDDRDGPAEALDYGLIDCVHADRNGNGYRSSSSTST